MSWYNWMSVFVLAIIFGNTIGDDQSPTSQCIDMPHDETPCTRGCKPGFHGLFCNETCSEHCGGACSQDTGHCLTGCKPNWFTSNCSQPCSGNCVDNVCDRRSAECIRGCKDGFYGLNCNETCSGNCTEGKCDVNGGCHCEKDVLDKFCYIDCSDNCIGGLCDVDQDGQLKCLKGCKEGRVGIFCNERCPYECPNCDSSCVSEVMRRRAARGRSMAYALRSMTEENNCRDTGKCQDAYRGPKCDIDCPNCVYDKSCQLSCIGGSWGSECHLECPENCTRASDGRSLCNQEGLCSSGCLQGYFGHSCELKCSNKCHKKLCLMYSGTCSDGCHPSYWGRNCTKRCGNCKDMKCEQNGSCTCIDKFYGRRCEDYCPDQCQGNCIISHSGHHLCKGNCTPGYSGVDCLGTCPSGCRSSGCGRETGNCAIAAIQGTDQKTITIILVVCVVIPIIVLIVIISFVAYRFRKGFR